ncbi:MAG: HD domain-containing protein [Phycisphaeraceae bacterium]|nr:HD domain-containing protein [Phycisphaeraceae bacterium]
MLRVDVRHARPGMSLALPILNPAAPGRILLRVGYEMTPEVLGRLNELGIRQVWVRYPSLNFLEKFIDPATIQKQSAVVEQISSTFEKLQTESTARLDYDQYTQSIGELIQQLISNPATAVFLGDIAEDANDLMRHSSAVMYLALLMGLKLEGYIVRERKHVAPDRAKKLRSLGLGAMLHDIGITMLPDDVREQYQQTGDESDPVYREHTTLGYRLVREQVEPTVSNILLHHHQRYDGSGWSGGGYPVLHENRIHIFTRIVALADQYDRLRHPLGGEPQPAVRALAALRREPLIDQFDPSTLAALFAIAPPYPPGATVRLSDGRFAVCVDHLPEQPCRPKVQIINDPAKLNCDDAPGETLDLSSEQCDSLLVVEADGCDVRKDNFRLPQEQG